MPETIERKEFACIAEAVVEYYKRGFTTVYSNPALASRIMISDTQEVWIRSKELLSVVATVIPRFPS